MIVSVVAHACCACVVVYVWMFVCLWVSVCVRTVECLHAYVCVCVCAIVCKLSTYVSSVYCVCSWV